MKELIEMEKRLLIELQAVRLVIHKFSNNNNKGMYDTCIEVEKRPAMIEEKETVSEACRNYFINNNNHPVAVSTLKGALHEQDVYIPGKNPGASIGAILNGRKNIFLFHRNSNEWSLKTYNN